MDLMAFILQITLSRFTGIGPVCVEGYTFHRNGVDPCVRGRAPDSGEVLSQRFRTLTMGLEHSGPMPRLDRCAFPGLWMVGTTTAKTTAALMLARELNGLRLLSLRPSAPTRSIASTLVPRMTNVLE